MTGFQTQFAMILLASLLAGAPAMAQPLSFFPQQRYDSPLIEDEFDLDPESIEPESGDVDLPSHLRRQIVGYPTREAPGTVIVDTSNTYLYFVLGNGRAIRYGIGVGREGFTWSGVRAIDRKAEWPDWTPPAQMIERQPYLPRWFAGGPSNPLGARALYLGGTLYRIHGTNQPSSIGKRVSSGCIRLVNDDIIDLHSRVRPGTKVVVLPATRVANAKRRAPVEPIEEFDESEDFPVSRPPANVARPLFPNPFGMN